MSDEIKVGVPVFYKPEMRWVKPTRVYHGKNGILFAEWEQDGRTMVSDSSAFTYSPVIPPKPEPEVEWVEDEIPVIDSFELASGNIAVVVRDLPSVRKNMRVVLDRPKREGE